MDDLSLAPLVITPAMAAAARAQQAQEQPAPAPPPAPPPPEPPVASAEVVQLKAMFPDYDEDVLASVLAIQEGNIEMAIQQLLDMGNADAPPPTDAMLASSIDSDEELAMALFRQFAEEMGTDLGITIPEDVQNDPERYEAYVREHFERELARPDSQLTARANRALESNSALRQQYEQQGGRQGFLERMLKGSKKVSVVSVDQGSAPLLSNDHERV